jgi:DNA-binding NarL/FixJ family response regulator
VIAESKPPVGTLVVVDDHAGFRQVVRKMLTAAGWQVIGEASTGAAAPDMVMLEHEPRLPPARHGQPSLGQSRSRGVASTRQT